MSFKTRALIWIHRIGHSISKVPLGKWLYQKVCSLINWIATNRIANATGARPNTYSLWSDRDNKTRPKSNEPDEIFHWKSTIAPNPPVSYLSWPGVVNKFYFSRHLPPTDLKPPPNTSQGSPSNIDDVNRFGEVTALFNRDGAFKEGRSNVLFMFFAQWFTDGFFRSDSANPRMTGSRHNVDLCQIYGANEDITSMLRSEGNGKLKTLHINGVDQRLPDLLYERVVGSKTMTVKQEYMNLPYVGKPLEKIIRMSIGWSPTSIKAIPDSVLEKIHSTGLDRGNGTLGNLSLNTLFIREHNLICDKLIESGELGNDDDRIFQTARIINIALLIKLTIEEYINHVSGIKLFKFDPSFAESKKWFREPWIAAEFNLLYRWHSMVPDSFKFKGGNDRFRGNHGFLSTHGLDDVLSAACNQAAGEIALGNTKSDLLFIDKKTLELARNWKFSSFNAYRKSFRLPRINSFEELTDDTALRSKLINLYDNKIDSLELMVGLYAEKKQSPKLAGDLLITMVGYDALTQLYTNPILARKNFTEAHFTECGMEHIESTHSLTDFVLRNTTLPKNTKINFDAPSNGCPYEKSGTPLGPQKYDDILCPSLKTGVQTGKLNPDSHGWVTSDELKSYLVFLGWLPKSFVLKQLMSLSEKKTKIQHPGFVNITALKDTVFDHGSSSGVLNNQTGEFSQSRLNQFKSFADSSGRLYAKQLIKAAVDFHINPVNRSSKLGATILLLEFANILDLHGQVAAGGRKYLAANDLENLWHANRYPESWSSPDKPFYGDLKTFWSLGSFGSRFLWFRLVRVFNSY